VRSWLEPSSLQARPPPCEAERLARAPVEVSAVADLPVGTVVVAAIRIRRDALGEQQGQEKGGVNHGILALQARISGFSRRARGRG
jgi:hypothetical protein